MKRSVITRVPAVVAAGITLSGLGVSGVSAAGAATKAAQPAAASAQSARSLAGPGARLWVKRYNGPGNGSDVARSVAASPGGGRVFVTGQSVGSGSGSDYLTVAYNAATGARLWTARYNGPVNGADVARAIAVSPSGATVFVTGESTGQPTDGSNAPDYATVAYRASDGRQLWVARYNGPGNWADSAHAVSVSRDGTAVFVTGESAPTFTDRRNYATVAYRAATGAQLWVSRYAGPEGQDSANAVVSPGANRVFVTGYSRGGGNEATYATVAYNAVTGARLWVRRYAGPGLFFDVATSVAASPDLRKVYVTGRDGGYATVAYKAATGAQLWVRRYTGPSTGRDDANAVAVSPGGTVLVTGVSDSAHAGSDYATIAYSPAGTRLWLRRYNGPGNGADDASALVAPGNGKVYVTGTSRRTTLEFATVAYNVSTGARLWVQRYNGPAVRADFASSIAARSGRVFVAGTSRGTSTGLDYVTIAYRG